MKVIKVYPKKIKARTIHFCVVCSKLIRRGIKYQKVRVDAELPFSKATRLKPIHVECATRLGAEEP